MKDCENSTTDVSKFHEVNQKKEKSFDFTL